jgi:hydrogenase maturation protease
VHLVRGALPAPGGRPLLTLVIGLGNDWRRDDAAGLEVARRIGATTVREPSRLLDAWRGAGSVVVVDAVRSGAEPGRVHRVDAVAVALDPSVFGVSTHHVGLAGAIELARELGRLPAALIVYGIEGHDFTAGRGLSPAVERAVVHVAEELRSATVGSPR